MALVDKVGRLVGFRLTPGNAHEPHSLSALRDGILANELIADQAYDTNATLALLAERDITAGYRRVRTGKRRAGMTLVCTGCVILWRTGLRHPIKEYRGIATRY